MLNGIKNFLEFVDANWMNLVIIAGLLIGLYKKVSNYLKKSNEEKVAIAKHQIREIMLKMISDAECDYDEWNKSGAIKRSQVIKKIYEMYPILSKVVNQEELTEWIDAEIDDSLETLNDIVNGIGE
jgi:uncharacterized protein YneF (UPF0154 family)